VTAPANSSTRFAGWRILAVAVITSILTGPGQTIGVSVFIDPMVSALNISRSVVSGAYLVGTLTGATAMPFVGRYIDRHGIRRSQILIGLGFTIALINMAGVQNAIWLAVGFAGIRMMGQGALSMIPTVAVSLWFERRRGVAMGVLATVAGAGMVAVPVVLNAVIDATSWRWAWLIAAGFTLITVIPLGWFALIDRPSDVGQVPDGGPAPGTSTQPLSASGQTLSADPTPVATRSFTRAEAVRTRQFWILASVSTITGMLVTGLNFHQIDLLGEAGLSSGQAAAMFLPQIVGSSVTGIAVGYVMDRVGVRLVPALTMVLLIGVHLLGVAIAPGAVVFLYAVSLGATGGAVRACLSTMLPGYFGTDHIGSIQGIMTLTGVIGSALGPVTLALAESRFGSYQSANLILMTLPVATLLVTFTNRST
jgi:MFS family permease